MVVKTNIADPATGIKASVVNEDEENALVVATRELKSRDLSIKFFQNTTYGIDMNQDASFGGTPVGVHNGIDDVLLTASAIDGTWVFDSTDEAHTGTKSIDATGTGDGSVAQFAKGASLDLSGYTALTGWIYVTGWDANKDSLNVFGWDTGTGLIVGNSIDIKDYVNVEETGVWQKFTISLGDLGLTDESIDSLRFEVIAKPKFYLDDIQFEETGSPIDFEVIPDDKTWLYVRQIDIFVVDAYAGTLADATMPNIPYDGLFGESALTNGLVFRRFNDGEISFSFVVRSLQDLLQLPSTHLDSYGSDGTNSWFKLSFVLFDPVILRPENDDKMVFTLSDDLSGLIRFRVSVFGSEEDRKRK